MTDEEFTTKHAKGAKKGMAAKDRMERKEGRS